MLYSIQFLHQITTALLTLNLIVSCIVSNFYIKSQLHGSPSQILGVVQYPISTSNHNRLLFLYKAMKLYSIQFLHQITTFALTSLMPASCIVSNFYIKSQQEFGTSPVSGVVQYPISTSNHNNAYSRMDKFDVVQYPISTSNHNRPADKSSSKKVVQYPISTSNHN